MIDCFDSVCSRKGTGSVKWDSAGKVFGNDRILPMWIADMDFRAPDMVIDAVRQRAEHGIFGYIDKNDMALNEAVAGWMCKRYGWRVEEDWIRYSPSVVSSLSIATIAFTCPGDRILLQSPVYPPFFSVIEKNHRRVVNSRLKLENGQYTMDFDDLEKQFVTGVKMMFLCSPHNPVGRVWSDHELKRLAQLCLKYDVLVVSDEIHSDIVYDGHSHIPIASVSGEMADHTITCVSPGKTFNIAGLVTSTVIIPNEKLRDKFSCMVESLNIDTGNIFGLTAAVAAYRHGEEWLNCLLSYLQENREFLSEYIKDIPRIRVTLPEGTFLAWLDMRELGVKDDELRYLIIHKANLGLNDGALFGPGGEGFQRLNFACPRAILEDGLQRLKCISQKSFR